MSHPGARQTTKLIIMRIFPGFITVAAIIIGSVPNSSGQQTAPLSVKVGNTDPLVEKVRQAALCMQRKDWEQGVVAQAFLEAGNDEMTIRMARASLIYANDEGRPAVLGDSGLIDCSMLGEALWRAAELTGDPALKTAEQRLREHILKHAARTADGTLYHARNQIWVDSYNCASPYLAATGNNDEALKQIEGLRKRLWNPEKKLFSHIWDEGGQKFVDKAFWGVGNGWAAVGMTRVIRALPADRQADKERLVGQLRELLDGCLAYQRSDGLFHNVVDQPDSFVEVNLGQMLAYSIYTGIGGGWLLEDYRKAADRMRSAARAKVDKYGFVQDVCGAPIFGSPGIAPEGQAFFLLMETAYKKLDQMAK
jgi:unsaturated rhamnogalacturonyl hydrolase